MICSAYPSLGYYHFAPATLWNASDNTASRSDFAKKVGFSYLLGPKTTCSRILGPTTTEDPENLKVCPCGPRLPILRNPVVKRKIGSEGDTPLSSKPKGADGDQVKTEVTEGIFPWGEVNPNSTAPEMRPN